jgi:hypothetical protein
MYLGYVIFDVITDWIIIDNQSGNNLTTVANFQTCNVLGSSLSTLAYFVFIGNNVNLGDWQGFYGLYIGLGVIFLVYGMRFREKNLTEIIQATISKENLVNHLNTPSAQFLPTPSSVKEKEQTTINEGIKRAFVFIILFSGFSQVNILADFVFEPYLVIRFGGSFFTTFSAVIIISNLVGLVIFLILLRHKAWVMEHRTRIIIFCGLYAIVNWVIILVKNPALILIFAGIGGFISNTLNFCFISILIDLTPPVHKAFYYQVFAMIYGGFNYFYRALGPLIAAVLSPEILFVGIIFLLFGNLPVLMSLQIGKVRNQMGMK